MQKVHPRDHDQLISAALLILFSLCKDMHDDDWIKER